MATNIVKVGVGFRGQTGAIDPTDRARFDRAVGVSETIEARISDVDRAAEAATGAAGIATAAAEGAATDAANLVGPALAESIRASVADDADRAEIAAAETGITPSFPPPAPGPVWTEDGGLPRRMRERLLVGGAADYAGSKFPGLAGTPRSWVGQSLNGAMTYFDTRSQVSVYSLFGGIALATAARSSDSDRATENGTIGIGSFVDNNNPTFKTGAWGGYIHAVRRAGQGSTHALEVDLANAGDLVEMTPYRGNSMLTGVTPGIWVSAGGEAVVEGSLTDPNPNSVAIGVVSNGSADGSVWHKGIVFQANAIAGTVGDGTGTGIAIEMGRGHEIVGRFSGGVNAYNGKIRFDGNDAARQQRIIFGSSGLTIRGVSSDLTSETTLFRVAAPVMTAGQSANYINVLPAAGAAGDALAEVAITADGPAQKIDLVLAPKAGGAVKIGYSTVAAAAPESFTANRYLPFKDASGTTYYIPCRSSPW